MGFALIGESFAIWHADCREECHDEAEDDTEDLDSCLDECRENSEKQKIKLPFGKKSGVETECSRVCATALTALPGWTLRRHYATFELIELEREHCLRSCHPPESVIQFVFVLGS